MNSELLEMVYRDPDVYKIYVPLPDNPLKNLNCYVIKTPEKNLIIDTGFNRPECKAALLAGLKELGISMDNTEIYATHVHSDHTGLIGEIMQPDTVVYMSGPDWEHMRSYSVAVPQGWNTWEAKMRSEGFPQRELDIASQTNPAKNFANAKPFVPQVVEDGQIISVGPYRLQVVLVPGHTPGNTCLYLADKKLLFCGDHILFDITPNITAWPGMTDALGSYLESLKKVRQLDIETALPAHRKNDMDVYERIDALLLHHQNRLQNTIDTLRQFPGSTAYDVASHLTWSMRGKDWTEFPVHQKWFAVGETLSHLDYLILRNQVEKYLDESGLYRYRLL